MAGGEKRTAWWRDRLIFSNELMVCPSLTDEPLWQNLISNYLQLTNINQQLTCMNCGPGQAWRLLTAGLFSSPAFCWSGRGAADMYQTSGQLLTQRSVIHWLDTDVRVNVEDLRGELWGQQEATRLCLNTSLDNTQPCFIYQSSSFIFWCIFYRL